MASQSVCTKTFELNNGLRMPAVGLGTWQGSPGTDDDKALEKSIIHALKSGYRLLDTAQAYGVEHVIGRAVRESGIPREDITVVTKFWGEWHHDPAEALRISLESLGLDYVDVLLTHWPWATTPKPEKAVLRPHEDPRFEDTWKRMEKLVGPTCKSIGVSNFSQKTLDRLLQKASIVPAVNQVELHAFNPCLKLVPYCQEKGIHVMSWSTLGGSRAGEENQILRHETFTKIADAHGCSAGVVSLSWAVQRGITVIPKSSSEKRIAENIKLVTLSDEEIDTINKAQDTIKKYRIAEGIQSLKGEVDGKLALSGWTMEDFGWEDAEGNWLT
ncbi:hypothetical protein VD0004_g1672 [Verticillium dahliae]|uniref:NADP-dependent oxidoreductase domain-containing protein n=1 Tax=Verticillium dahliae TaxID=27337 RepID=A0A444RNG3_VERDA|nr:hypothetical protein VD0004_g1672 [Verticillium dahliae]PNH76402.1 hypothetical protein VD0001_g1095 [Verticillium dahliae]RXG42699.1 hypothetical protein VDGE_03614 [Verticillium dahliae]